MVTTNVLKLIYKTNFVESVLSLVLVLLTCKHVLGKVRRWKWKKSWHRFSGKRQNAKIQENSKTSSLPSYLLPPWVNFTNILQAAFLYVSVISSISLLTVYSLCFDFFLAREKDVHKILGKLLPYHKIFHFKNLSSWICDHFFASKLYLRIWKDHEFMIKKLLKIVLSLFQDTISFLFFQGRIIVEYKALLKFIFNFKTYLYVFGKLRKIRPLFFSFDDSGVSKFD